MAQVHKANDEPIKELSDFVRLVGTHPYIHPTVDRQASVFCRGHGSTEWNINPVLFRDARRYQDENSILRSVIASQPDSFSDDQTMLDKMVRMQHFSVPTRLLDVTKNPLVALYFCVADQSQRDKPGEVLFFSTPSTSEKFFDSDAVSCLANLAYLSHHERDVLERNLYKDRKDFNALPKCERLLNFIKAEKPYFQPLIRPEDLQKPWLVKPKLNNRRIVAQNGAFIIFGLDKTPLDLKVSNNMLVEKVEILPEYKDAIRNQLNYFNVNQESMFPDLEGVSKYITEQYR
jgi:FRG domain